MVHLGITINITIYYGNYQNLLLGFFYLPNLTGFITFPKFLKKNFITNVEVMKNIYFSRPCLKVQPLTKLVYR